MARPIHQVVQHRSGIAGVEAMSLLTEHVFPRHAHDQFGIGAMVSGAQRSWSVLGAVESAAGDAIMLNPGELHDGAPLDGARGWHIVYLDPGLVAREAAEEGAGELVVRPVAHDRLLAARIGRLFGQLQAAVPDRMAVEESLLCCLMHASQRHRIDGPLVRRRSPAVGRAVQRLEQAPELATSLAELAELAGSSRFQLLRGFCREVGTTPHAYLVQLRVRLARRCLAEGQVPAQAAVSAGFADQSHMTRAFLRQLGVTPGRYRAALA